MFLVCLGPWWCGCRCGRCWRRRRRYRLGLCSSFPPHGRRLRHTVSRRLLTRLPITTQPVSPTLAPISSFSPLARLILRAATVAPLGESPRYFHVVRRIDGAHIDVVCGRKRRRFARSSRFSRFPVVLVTAVLTSATTTVSTTPTSPPTALLAAARSRGRGGGRGARGGRGTSSRPAAAKVRGVAVVAATLATRTALFFRRAFGLVPTPPLPILLSLFPRVVIYLSVRIARNVHMLRSEEHSD